MAATIEAPRTAEEEKKQAWIIELSKFIVEANKATWAGNGKEVKPQRPGYKELEYPPQKHDGDIPQIGFYYRDSYSGFFRAPGMSTVYYNGKTAWTLQYGGTGMTEGQEVMVEPTFDFLKKALDKVTPEIPIRGPLEFSEGEFKYNFKLVPDINGKVGNLENCKWIEQIYKGEQLMFTQDGMAGIVINKGEDGKPIHPWNL